jgi:hypothetical protein
LWQLGNRLSGARDGKSSRQERRISPLTQGDELAEDQRRAALRRNRRTVPRFIQINRFESRAWRSFAATHAFALVIVSKLASRPRSIAPAMRLSLFRPERHGHWLWPWMKFTHLWFIASGTTGILSKESRGAFCGSNSAVTREPNQAMSPHRAEKHGSCAKQFRARASRDITVPMGSPQISAISR